MQGRPMAAPIDYQDKLLYIDVNNMQKYEKILVYS